VLFFPRRYIQATIPEIAEPHCISWKLGKRIDGSLLLRRDFTIAINEYLVLVKTFGTDDTGEVIHWKLVF